MSVIYEIYGHRLNDISDEAKNHRARAWCPFMDNPCDGGGNRSQSTLDLNAPSIEA
jgi:hypothetical protein